MCAHLPFDSWRVRHDRIKFEIQSIASDSGVLIDAEPYGLFSHLIPSEAFSNQGHLKFKRERQGLVPDFSLSFPSESGAQVAQLAELKLLSAGSTWYHTSEKTVEVRAKQLPRLYEDKAKNIDRRYCGSTPSESGPLESRLKEFGALNCWVIGQFGECSADLHNFLSKCANEKAMKIQCSTVYFVSDFEKSQILLQIRRRLSISIIKAQSSCLLSRLNHFGQGAKLAAKRREQELYKADMQRADLRAHWESCIRGRRITKVGSLHI